MAEDRLLNRIETLVGAIRKTDAALAASADPARRVKLVKLRAEYQQSIKNIQTFGREKMPLAPGVTINVPTDVMRVVKA